MDDRGRIAIGFARQHAARFELLINDCMPPRTRYTASPSRGWRGMTMASGRRGASHAGRSNPRITLFFRARTGDFPGSLNFPDQIDVV